MTVLQVLETYLTELGRSMHTLASYKQDLVLFSRWFEKANGQELQADNLTPTDIRLYRQFLQAETHARPATINRRLAALRTFGQALIAAGLAEYNPAEQIRSIPEQALGPKWLDKREQAALLRELDLEWRAAHTESGKRQAVRDQTAVIMLLNTGMRISELCDLEMGDLTLTARMGSLQIRRGKGEKARKVPLNHAALTALRSWLQLRGDEPGRVFCSRRGTLTPRALQQRLRNIGSRANIKVTPHMLRHSFAKNLVNVDVSLEKVAALLGHSNLNTTKIYTMPGESDLAAAVETLDW